MLISYLIIFGIFISPFVILLIIDWAVYKFDKSPTIIDLIRLVVLRELLDESRIKILKKINERH